MEQVSGDLENNGMSFIWKMHNYSYCGGFRKGQSLCSPTFKLNDCSCYILLYPSGVDRSENFVLLRFDLRHVNKLSFSSLKFEVSILKNSGLFHKVGFYSASPIKSVASYCSSLLSLGLPCLRKDRYGFKDYLCNDTLTVKIRFFNANNIILPQICCAYTVINVQRTVYNWKMDTACNSNKIRFPEKEASNLNHGDFTLDVSLGEQCSDGGKFEVLIKRSSGKALFSTCTLSIVEDGSIVLHSKQNEHWFEEQKRDVFGLTEPKADQIWNISYTPTINVMGHKKDCKRFLRFEFATSDGSITVERMEYGITTIKSVLGLDSKPPQHPVSSVCVHSWKDNLLRFQSEGKLSDVTLRTSAKEFPAHKAMLCAQSKVFSAMFEHDTKENRTGIVEIEDLEDETVSRMLNFVYTGVFENIDWKTATMLYFAADKYEIMALKEQCSAFLKANLSTLNVCKCLILADMHQDQPFKSFAQEFVQKHSCVILKSEEWKKLMKNHVNLAAETMYMVCLKNS